MSQEKPWRAAPVRKRLLNMIARGGPRTDGVDWLPSRFRFEGRLGQGGEGVVVAAHDTELDRPVAIKTRLWPTSGEDEQARRFRREGEALAALRHPNVVTIHELLVEEGADCLVMERIDGESLAETIQRRGPLPPEEVYALGLQLADALEHIHARDVFHRDLKPANIVMDAQGQPKIVDFGLVRRDGESRLTATGAILGTPGFLSPEQVRGGAIDARTDIYGLGATLYAALTGRAPCDAESPHATLAAVLHRRPAAAAALAPRVPPGLSAACARCLAKDPDARFASAAELQAELQRSRAQGDPCPWRGAALAGAAILSVVLGAAALLGDRPSAPTAQRSDDPAPPPAASAAPTASSPWAVRGSRAFSVDRGIRRVGFLGSRPVAWSIVQLWIWDTPEDPPRTVSFRRGTGANPRDIELSPAGSFVVVGYPDEVVLVPPDRPRDRRHLQLPADVVACSADDVIAAADNARLTLTFAETGARAGEVGIPPGALELAFSPDGRLLLGLFEVPGTPASGAVSVWSVPAGSLLAEWSLAALPTCGAVSDEGQVAVGDEVGGVSLFDLRAPGARDHLRDRVDPIGRPRAHSDDVSDLLWLPGGELLTMSRDDPRGELATFGNDLAWWRLRPRPSLLRRLLATTDRRYLDAALSPDGELLSVCSGDPIQVHLHSLASLANR